MKMQAVYEADGVSCTRVTTIGHEMKAMHIHDVYEVYMVLSSGVKCFVNDRIYALEPGDVMLFSSADLHRASMPQNVLYDRYVVTFPPQLLRQHGGEKLLDCFEAVRAGGSHRLTLSVQEQQTLRGLLRVLEAEAKQPVEADLGQWLALGQILLFLGRAYRRVPQALPTTRQSHNPQVRAVLEYIDANFQKSITLDELSALCYLNKHYLCRLFKQQTGFCIHDYITYRRLACAAALLREGKSVSEAAGLSGFGSDTFFITTFKKNVGVTPYRYACRCRPEIMDTP